MAVTTANRLLTIFILFNAFIVGGVLMGFEMLGSRYLFPYFGGGIGTWASLISTVLCALAIGYFSGGAIVDRYHSSRITAAALLLVPLSLLGTFSPVAVGLLTRSAEESGGVAGLVYGVSTVGNVVGTLVTTFVLIPVIGSRSITYLY